MAKPSLSLNRKHRFSLVTHAAEMAEAEEAEEAEEEPTSGTADPLRLPITVKAGQLGLNLLEQGRVTTEAEHQQVLRRYSSALAQDTGAPIQPRPAFQLFWIRCLSFDFYSATTHQGGLPDRFVYKRPDGNAPWSLPLRLEA